MVVIPRDMNKKDNWSSMGKISKKAAICGFLSKTPPAVLTQSKKIVRFVPVFDRTISTACLHSNQWKFALTIYYIQTNGFDEFFGRKMFIKPLPSIQKG